MNKQLSLLLLALPFIANAQKEIETVAKIDFVTVYTSAAEINYEKEITLPKGKTTVVFTDLTPFITENSINISVSNPKVNIITVAERINYAKEKRSYFSQLASYKDSVKRMKRELGLLNVKSETANVEKALLFKGESIGGLSHGVKVAEIEKASAFFSKRYFQLTKDLNYLNERESELEERINNCENQLKESNTVSVKTISEIKVTVNCTAEEKVKFNFKFLTAKAGWVPVYDIKYEGAVKPLQFVFRANISNASGTPWQDVKMKLSTADPIHGFALPELDQETTKANALKEEKFRQSESVNAISEYGILHEYSIPSDAKPYTVDVSTHAIPASFNYLLIPKMDPFGFLMAKIPDWNKYNFIPGTTNIYSMGTYMGKTFLNTYSNNDTLGVYLGKDKNIQSSRTEKNINHSHFFIGNYSVEENHTDITIKNNSTEQLPIEVIDQVPVFTKEDKEKISVFGISAAFFDKAEGMLTWYFPLKGGESISINYSYEIKIPKESYEAYGMRRKKFRTISCPSF